MNREVRVKVSFVLDLNLHRFKICFTKLYVGIRLFALMDATPLGFRFWSNDPLNNSKNVLLVIYFMYRNKFTDGQADGRQQTKCDLKTHFSPQLR